MAAQAEIKAVITADDRASSTLKGFSTKIGDLSVGMAALGAGVVQVSRMAFDFLSESVKQFSEAQRASKMLENAVINVSGATREQLTATEKLAEAISAKGVLDDDVIKQGLAQLSTFRLSNDAVRGLSQSLADLTVNQFGVSATGEQAADAANMMAKALNGQFGILEKSGIKFTDAQKQMILYGSEAEKVAAVQKGFAENLKYTNDVAKDTAEGSFARMQVAIGNMQESIGGALAPALGMLATKLADFVNSDNFKAWLEKVTVWIRDELPPFLERLFNEYIPNAARAFEEWYPKIKMVADILGAIVGAIVWVAKAIEDMSSSAGLSIGYVMLWFSDLGKWISSTVNSVINWFTQLSQKIIQWKDQAVQSFNNFINEAKAIPGKIISAIGNLANLLYQGGRDLIQGLINGVASMAGSIGNKIKEVAQGAVDKAKSILGIKSPSTVFAGIGENIGKGMVQGLENTQPVVNASVSDMIGTPIKQSNNYAPATITRQQETAINISLSGIFTGTPGEARKLAEMVASNLKTIANSRNITVAEMMGV